MYVYYGVNGLSEDAKKALCGAGLTLQMVSAQEVAQLPLEKRCTAIVLVSAQADNPFMRAEKSQIPEFARGVRGVVFVTPPKFGDRDDQRLKQLVARTYRSQAAHIANWKF